MKTLIIITGIFVFSIIFIPDFIYAALPTDLCAYTITQEYTSWNICYPPCTTYNCPNQIRCGDAFGDCDDGDLIINIDTGGTNICFNSYGSDSGAPESVRIKYPTDGSLCNVVLGNNIIGPQQVCCISEKICNDGIDNDDDGKTDCDDKDCNGTPCKECVKTENFGTCTTPQGTTATYDLYGYYTGHCDSSYINRVTGSHCNFTGGSVAGCGRSIACDIEYFKGCNGVAEEIIGKKRCDAARCDVDTGCSGGGCTELPPTYNSCPSPTWDWRDEYPYCIGTTVYMLQSKKGCIYLKGGCSSDEKSVILEICPGPYSFPESQCSSRTIGDKSVATIESRTVYIDRGCSNGACYSNRIDGPWNHVADCLDISPASTPFCGDNKNAYYFKTTYPGVCKTDSFPHCSFGDPTTELVHLYDCSPQCCVMAGIQVCGGTCATGDTRSCTINSAQGTETCQNNCTWGACVSNTHNDCNDQEQCVIVNTPGVDQCLTNDDCVGGRHNECNAQEQCVVVQGDGVDQCLTNADCQNLPRCNAQRQCVINGTGNLCNTGADCATQPTCSSDNKCVIGGGGGTCTADADCTGKMGCNNLLQCVLGGHGIECATDTDCQNLPKCNAQKQCVIDGTGKLCNIDTDCQTENQPPYPENLTVFESYCVGIPECGEVSFQWTYRDPDGDPQSRFDLQVDNNINFSSPEVNQTFDGLSNPDGTVNTQIVLVKPEATTVGGNYLTFDTRYYWQVRVWDSGIPVLNSGWVIYDPNEDEIPDFFLKDPHPHPAPEFSFIPQNLKPGELVNFTDQSICYESYDLDTDTYPQYPCKNINPNTGTYNAYTWQFGDDTSNTVRGNTSHTYRLEGIYPVTLTVCDDAGCCWISHNVLVGTGNGPGTGAPLWREISPF